MRSCPPHAVALALVAALWAGCSEGYRVLVRFDPPELVEELAAVEVIVVDSCADQPADGAFVAGQIARLEVHRGERPEGLGELDPGEVGLLVRGSDGDCRVVALGCSSVRLRPGEQGLLIVTGRPVDGPGCEDGARCLGGECVPAGDADADTDADADADADADTDEDADADAGCPCDIDGTCWEAGEVRPGHPCEACRPEVADDDWSRVDEASPCRSSGQDGTCRTEPLGGMSCCTGCWVLEGLACVPGGNNAACGDRGEPCELCIAPNRCDPILHRCEPI